MLQELGIEASLDQVVDGGGEGFGEAGILDGGDPDFGREWPAGAHGADELGLAGLGSVIGLGGIGIEIGIGAARGEREARSGVIVVVLDFDGGEASLFVEFVPLQDDLFLDGTRAGDDL